MRVITVLIPSVFAFQDTDLALLSAVFYRNGSNGGFSNLHPRPQFLSEKSAVTGVASSKLHSPQSDYEVTTEAACSQQGYPSSKGQIFNSSHLFAGSSLLSLPRNLSRIESLWSNCTSKSPNHYIHFLPVIRPIIALQPAKGLVSNPVSTPDHPAQAKPASSPTHSLPIQTATSELDVPAEGQSSTDGYDLNPSNASTDQTSKNDETVAPTPAPNSGLSPVDQRQEDASVATSSHQDAGHEDLTTTSAHQESDAKDGDPPQIPGPAGESQQSTPFAAEDQQRGGNDSPTNQVSHQDGGIQGANSAAVDNTKPDKPSGASIVVGTHTISVDASGTSFDSVPLEPQGSPVTVSGAAAIIQGSSIIVGDAIIHLPPPTTDNPTLIAGHKVTPLVGAVAIDGETLRAGESPRTIAGTLMSLGSNDYLAINPTVQALPTSPPQAVGNLVDGQTNKIDGQAFEVLSNGISIGGTTLTPGGPAAIVSGTRISLGSTALVIDRSTIPVSPASPSPFTTVIGGQVITAAPSSIILQGTSLEPGAPGMTLDNTLISLNKAGSLILGSRTMALGGSSLITRIGDQRITAGPTGVQIAGGTLLPGAAGWTINGTRVSLDAVGDVIISEKTISRDGHGTEMSELVLGGTRLNGAAASTSSLSNQTNGSSRGAGTEGKVFYAGAERLRGVHFWTAAAIVAIVAQV